MKEQQMRVLDKSASSIKGINFYDCLLSDTATVVEWCVNWRREAHNTIWECSDTGEQVCERAQCGTDIIFH